MIARIHAPCESCGRHVVRPYDGRCRECSALRRARTQMTQALGELAACSAVTTRALDGELSALKSAGCSCPDDKPADAFCDHCDAVNALRAILRNAVFAMRVRSPMRVDLHESNAGHLYIVCGSRAYDVTMPGDGSVLFEHDAESLSQDDFDAESWSVPTVAVADLQGVPVVATWNEVEGVKLTGHPLGIHGRVYIGQEAAAQ